MQYLTVPLIKVEVPLGHTGTHVRVLSSAQFVVPAHTATQLLVLFCAKVFGEEGQVETQVFVLSSLYVMFESVGGNGQLVTQVCEVVRPYPEVQTDSH